MFWHVVPLIVELLEVFPSFKSPKFICKFIDNLLTLSICHAYNGRIT